MSTNKQQHHHPGVRVDGCPCDVTSRPPRALGLRAGIERLQLAGEQRRLTRALVRVRGALRGVARTILLFHTISVRPPKSWEAWAKEHGKSDSAKKDNDAKPPPHVKNISAKGGEGGSAKKDGHAQDVKDAKHDVIDITINM